MKKDKDKAIKLLQDEIEDLQKEKTLEENVEHLAATRDYLCLVYGIKYEEILKLQTELEASGISANITVGGLQVRSNYKHPTVIRICKKYKTVAEPGVSRFVEKAMLGITKPITDPEAFLPSTKKKKTND